MSSLAMTARDTTTMLRRNLRHQLRYPTILIFQVVGALVFLLLFVFVFGETMGAGLPGASAGAGRSEYLAFITPGVLLLAVAGAGGGVAISVSTDMTSGIAARFRTMAISRGAVLTGHVLGAVLQTLLAVAIVVLVAVALGFRPAAGPFEWLAVGGVIILVSLAVTWLSTAMGVGARTVESASNRPMLLMLLPFFGSGFVPTEALPAGLRWFAEYQPFTPVMDLLRALLFDQPVGDSAWLTLAWCVALTLIGYVWAARVYERER
jgi:ABC-2 type transport system permease protein